MEWKTVHVTVGTTKFDSLIQAVASDEVMRILKSRGCQKLILQIGRGQYVDSKAIELVHGVKVQQYEFKFEPIRTDIIEADLIIGHAGAGTCMDILKHNKAGLVVVNEQLMDNHQLELAKKLAAEGYIYYCDISGLVHQLDRMDLDALKPYPKTNNLQMLVRCINDHMSGWK